MSNLPWNPKPDWWSLNFVDLWWPKSFEHKTYGMMLDQYYRTEEGR